MVSKINKTYVNLGFKRSAIDHSLYYAQERPHVIIVLVYSKDQIALSTVTKSMVSLKTTLMNKYDMKDLEGLRYCLGVYFIRD